MTPKKKVHIVSYTHWDREFRWDFETTRFWLVRLMDNLLDIMRQKPDYRHFMMDGQFVLIDDYLEIRPERQAEVRALVKAGRLQAGPWYTLPDSSSVNGESLIRNLMLGLKKAEDFGAAMKVGYNVFSFGQISQLPQLYAGFGIDTILFYKHMDRRRSRYDEFIWQGPDGTKALASRLGREARWNFFFAGHIPIVYNRDPWDKQWRYDWGQMGKQFHLCQPESYAGFHYITCPETNFHPERVKEGFQRTFDTLKQTAVPEHLLFFDGTDFTEPHPLIPEIIAEANKVFGEEYEIVHSTLADYIAAIKPLLAQRQIDTVTGHMKDGPVGAIHTDVVSIHPELKKANTLAENLLYRQAEPLAAVAWTLQGGYPTTQMDRALRFLFESQAHDSLHGVGPKELGAGGEHRLLQARLIGENIAVQAMSVLAGQIDTQSPQDTDMFLTVFNSSAFTRDQVVEAYLDIPEENNVDELYLEDAQGQRISVFVLDRTKCRAGLYHPRSRNMPIYVHRFRVIFPTGAVPGLGYKVLKIKFKEQSQYPYPHEDFDAVKTPFNALAKNPRQAENEFVTLTIAENGTLEIAHKATGKTYKNLHYFMDQGQKGNLYRCYPPEVDEIVTTLGQSARIALTINNAYVAQFTIETQLDIPVAFDKATQQRTRQRTTMPITSVVTIRKGNPVVDVETTFTNHVRDHFLRACFPTGITATTTHTGAVFNTETHNTAISQDGLWQGPELRRYQQHMFMDIHDDRAGMAILTETLRDYEVMDPAAGLIAMSLLRAVELRIPCDNRLWMEYPGDDSAQSLRQHTMRYGILAHAGDWRQAEVYRHALAFCTPLRLAQIAKQAGTLPFQKSFLNIDNPNLVFSALKKTDQRDSLIVRLYNATDSTLTGKITLGLPVREVFEATLAEQRLQPMPLTDANQISVTLGGKKILTLELVS